MTESRALVAAVVACALLAYIATVFVLASRPKPHLGWWLLTGQLTCGILRTASWLVLVFDNVRGPLLYDHIPPQVWSVLASAVIEAVILFWLALWILRGNRT